MREGRREYHGVLDPLQNDGVEVLVDGVDGRLGRTVLDAAEDALE